MVAAKSEELWKCFEGYDVKRSSQTICILKKDVEWGFGLYLTAQKEQKPLSWAQFFQIIFLLALPKYNIQPCATLRISSEVNGNFIDFMNLYGLILCEIS